MGFSVLSMIEEVLVRRRRGDIHCDDGCDDDYRNDDDDDDDTDF